MADYTSPFATGIEFLDRLGVYEVLLPFLLIYTLVFAILEKSKIFGTEIDDGKEVSKKNFNSMFAFVTAFLVVASSRLVSAINEAVANLTILLLLGFSFLLLVGVFHTGDKELKVKGPFQSILTWVMFIGILLIFLHAIKTEDGTPWLFFGWNFLVSNFDTGAMGALILTIFIIIMITYISSEPGSGNFLSTSDNEKEDH